MAEFGRLELHSRKGLRCLWYLNQSVRPIEVGSGLDDGLLGRGIVDNVVKPLDLLR